MLITFPSLAVSKKRGLGLTCASAARAWEVRRDGGDKGGDLGPVLYQPESGF